MKKRGRIRIISSTGTWIILICCILLLIKNPALSASFVKKGFEICVRSVIPAIFPFAVISSLLCVLETPRAFAKLISLLFGVSKEGAGAVVSGLLSGFPIGGMCTFELYGAKRISKAEAERLLCFTNNPSAAFVIGYVGLGVLGSARLGVMLYLTLVATSIVTAFILRPRGQEPFVPLLSAERGSVGISETVKAIKNTATTMLAVSSFIIAFSVIGGYIDLACAFLPENIRCAVNGVIEISGGINSIAESSVSSRGAFILSGAICSFSGISVHMQIASLNIYPELSMKKYCISKIVSAPLTASVCALLSLAL